MFERILLKPGSFGRDDVDLGGIAEAMVFYGQVHLVLNEGSLRSLVAKVGIDDLLLLADSESLNITVLRDGIATHEAKTAEGIFYDFISVQRLRQDRTERDPREIIQGALLDATGRQGKSRRSTERFLQRCHVESINEGAPHANGIPELSREDLDDPEYVVDAIRAALSILAPGYRVPLDFKFICERSQDGFRISTNLDLRSINEAHRQAFNASDSDISYALLVDALHEARGDLFLAARHSAELVTSPLSSAVASRRIENTLAKVVPMSQLDQLHLFQAELIPSRSIREAINRRERSVKELLELVEHAGRFRGWLSERPSDGRLLGEYARALMSGTWAERLPAKSVRYVIFTLASLAVEAAFPSGLGVTLGLGLGMGDTFLVDKVIKGWKPSQFVEKHLGPFLLQGSSRNIG